MGGTAWPNFRLTNERWESVIAPVGKFHIGVDEFLVGGVASATGPEQIDHQCIAWAEGVGPQELCRRNNWIVRMKFSGDLRIDPFCQQTKPIMMRARTDLDRAVLIDILGYPEDLLTPFQNLRLQLVQ